MQHVHHELLLRLRAVENDRWILRAASSGRSEVIDPHGVPSEEGIDIGTVGMKTSAFGHRDTFALGGRLDWFGPVAGAAAGLFLALWIVRRIRSRQALPEGPTAKR